MPTFQPWSDWRFTPRCYKAWWWLYACGVAIDAIAFSGCASMHESAGGMRAKRSTTASVWTDKSVEVVDAETTAEADPDSTEVTNSELLFRPASVQALPAASVGANRPILLPDRTASATGPIVRDEPTHELSPKVEDSSEGLGRDASPSAVIPADSVKPAEPQFEQLQDNPIAPVTYEPRPSFYKRLVNPFAADASQDPSETGSLHDSLGEADGADGEESGSGGPGGPGGPGGGMGGPNTDPGFGVTWYPSAAVSGQGTKLGFVRQSLNVDIPVWFKGADAVMVSVGVDESHFSGRAILPETLRAFPSDLWNVQVGLKHMRQFSNGRMSMLMLDVGSASDKPFHSTRDMSFQIGGFFNAPAKNGRDSWTVGAIYSPLGSPNFPIPLLAYRWNPSETFQMSIGLPCNLKWRPTDRFSVDVSYFPVLSANALATYKLSDRIRAYGGYQNVSDSYFLTDRVDRTDQFFAVESRLIAGVRRDVSGKITIDFNAGYAFDRHYGVGTSQSTLSDRVNLQSGAFLAGRLTWNF